MHPVYSHAGITLGIMEVWASNNGVLASTCSKTALHLLPGASSMQNHVWMTSFM